MTKRISELPAAAALSDADEFELNQGGASRKATHAQIVAGLASAAHQHTLADITDSGALAALDSVGTTQIDAAAFASGAEAIAGIDNAKIMTPLRTAEAVATLPPAPHQHTLVEITDSGALAGLDTVGTAELDDAAYASQPEAIAGTDNSKIMTALRTAQAIAALAPEHQHTLSDVTDAGALAALDLVGPGEIEPNAVTSGKIFAGAVGTDKLADHAVIASKLATDAVASSNIASGAVTEAKIADDAITQSKIAASAYASQAEATAGTDNAKLMTALRTAQAIAALGPEHQHTLSDVTDAGTLAALDLVSADEIEPNAVTSNKIAAGAVGTDELADQAVIASKLASNAVIAIKIASAAVTEAKIAEGAVTEAKIADDAITQSKIAASAYAAQAEATAGTDNAKLMTALRTAQAIAALATEHQHTLADVTDAGTLAALDLVGVGEIAPNAVNGGKIAAGAVGTDKLAEQAVTATKLASNAVTEAKIASAAVTEAKIADGAVGASKLQPGIPIDMQDAVLTAPELRDYSETSPSPAILAGTLILDLETGNVFQVTLTQNVTSLILAHPPAANRAGSCSLIVRQDGTGGRSLAWNGAIKWPGGTPPAVTSAANAVDVYSLVTRDGGVTWYGFLGGQDFS
jgi:trimeric autotransporter adhesin